jgi:homoserine O-acetyltransferase
MSQNTYKHQGDFLLESGQKIPDLELVYHTYGELNENRSNVVWAFHALSANADVMDWWPGLFGDNDYFNPQEYHIICVNVLGSPYGSTRPNDENFPLYTVRDVVKAHLLLADVLNISHIHVAIGGSFGGSQAIEFAYSFEGLIDNLILIASSAKESAWGIAIHESQRMAMKADPTFGLPEGGSDGIKAARAIGMLTYRSVRSFETQQTNYDDRVDDFDVSSYIQYQGVKFDRRFDSLSYYYLSKCMDTHNIGRDRGGVEQALNQIGTKTLVIGIDSDMLLPTRLQRFIASCLPNGYYREINSDFGHDGFLIETEKLTQTISKFIRTSPVKELNVEELKLMFDKQEDFQLIDVREKFELEIANIGGLHIPMSEVNNRLEEIDRSRQVVIYCRSGRRSAIAVEHIQQINGHDQLYNLAGGILDWADKIDNRLRKY